MLFVGPRRPPVTRARSLGAVGAWRQRHVERYRLGVRARRRAAGGEREMADACSVWLRRYAAHVADACAVLVCALA